MDRIRGEKEIRLDGDLRRERGREGKISIERLKEMRALNSQ